MAQREERSMVLRQSHRVKHRAAAQVSMPLEMGEAPLYDAVVEDISISGLRVVIQGKLSAHLASRSRAYLTIERSGLRPDLILAGSVVRSRMLDVGQVELAVRYDKINYQAVAAINTHVRVTLKLVPAWYDI